MVLSQSNDAEVSLGRGFILFLLIFGAVLWHELFHALVAAHAGAKARQIVLLPIGGISFMNPQADPDEPRDLSTELRIALAGPAANLLVALVSATMIAAVGPGVALFSKPLIHAGHLLRSLVWINAGLTVLNLIPAYPLDGGRILRAWLARSTSPPGA